MSGQDNGAVALKPCPFCGDTMFLTIASSRFTETLAGWQVECGCHIYGPFERTREEAITAWNTRPTPAQEQGLLEEAEAVLERALIGSQKYLRARVRTAISLIEKARHSSTPTEGAQ